MKILLKVILTSIAVTIIITSVLYYLDIIKWLPDRDDWEFIYRAKQDPTVGGLFLFHNGHPVAITRLLFSLLWDSEHSIKLIRLLHVGLIPLMLIFSVALLRDSGTSYFCSYALVIVILIGSLNTWGVFSLASNIGWFVTNVLLIGSLHLLHNGGTRVGQAFAMILSAIAIYSFGNGVFVSLSLGIYLLLNSRTGENGVSPSFQKILGLLYVSFSIAFILFTSRKGAPHSHLSVDLIVPFLELLGSPITPYYHNQSLPHLAFVNGALAGIAIIFYLLEYRGSTRFPVLVSLIVFSFSSIFAICYSRFTGDNYELFHNHRYSASVLPFFVALFYMLTNPEMNIGRTKKISLTYGIFMILMLQYSEFIMLVHRNHAMEIYRDRVCSRDYSDFSKNYSMPDSLLYIVENVNESRMVCGY